jgi:hypothetical protein
MKSLAKAIVFLLVFVLMILFVYNLFATGEDSTKSEATEEKDTYVSEVILRVPWAKRNLAYHGEQSPPGEFGLHAMALPDSLRGKLPDPPLPEGPTSFTVAPNGDIYITDPLNKRIQRFNANGSFVSVIPIPPLEKSEYLHIQELPELSDSAKVESLRRAGKLPKTLDQNRKEPKDLLSEPKTINGYQYVWSLICVDQSNNVYLLWWGDYTKQTLCKYDQGGQLLATYPFFPEVRGRGAGNKLYCDESDALFFEYYRKLTHNGILSIKEQLLLKEPYGPFTFQIGTADRAFNSEEQKATLRRGVRKALDLSEVKRQAWQELPGEFWGSQIWDYEYVDQDGNFYHYWPTKEGVIIAKWHKQP